MRKFDTKVQHLKYRVLREVAKRAWEGNLQETILDIPKAIVPGKIPTMRCCVYKERAIVEERIKIAMGGNKNNPSIIEVIDIACDECPAAGYEVTDSCRGCLANRCEDVCKRGAIYFDHNRTAHIDKTKCVECGQCAKVCPFSAIANRKRPCQSACKVKAISINAEGAAAINEDKCIYCGSCVYMCPFGAIMDKSMILDVVKAIKDKEKTGHKVYALVAPAIASQFSYAGNGRVVGGIRKLGFDAVYEVALGADMVALDEARELTEKGFLTSSCCPAFARYIRKNFPDLAGFISHNPSPMAALAKYIKSVEPDCKIVFIGPCTAKKAEIRLESVKPYVDAVITFEELEALLASKDIDLTEFEAEAPDHASYFGRVFARSGGLTEAVAEALKEQNLEDFEVKSMVCDGIEACKLALMKKSKGVLDANFIEGMACIGGCIGGAGCLTHGEKNKGAIDSYGKAAGDRKIVEAVESLKE